MFESNLEKLPSKYNMEFCVEYTLIVLVDTQQTIKVQL